MAALQKVLKSSGILAYKMFCLKYDINPNSPDSLKKYFREASKC